MSTLKSLGLTKKNFCLVIWSDSREWDRSRHFHNFFLAALRFIVLFLLRTETNARQKFFRIEIRLIVRNLFNTFVVDYNSMIDCNDMTARNAIIDSNNMTAC